MPMYEYRCQECGKTFELLRKYQDADKHIHCPACESAKVTRLLSGFATGGCGSGGGGRFT